jgi:hypothetical protein
MGNVTEELKKARRESELRLLEQAQRSQKEREEISQRQQADERKKKALWPTLG